ncbi:MAG TPA: alpha/beta hydrolase, partial [Ktedonobacteraceae bacterium]|nr:alpha/beta hydrolase [Ktedonobacteraceae bacterium]
HGLSSLPETGYAQDLLTTDVASLIHELSLSHPLVWGYSNGAVTAAQLAATYPQLVLAVVLEDPPWREATRQTAMAPGGAGAGEPWPGYQAWYASWLAWHRALVTQKPAERIASSCPFLPPGAFEWPEEELLSHLEAQAQLNLDVFHFIPPLPVPTSWRGTLERIACPVLLLTSDPQRGVAVTEPEVQAMAAAWRQGRQVSFPQASHFLHHEMQGEQFEHFMAVAEAFLKDSHIRVAPPG